jgi:hypothetical protein
MSDPTRAHRASAHAAATVAVLSVLFVATRAGAQSYNVDIDQTGSNPALGQGVPSSAFGAAASQPGAWNSFVATAAAAPLVDLSGAPTGATVQVTATSTTIQVLGFNNPDQTGDFALLLNDGSQIGTTLQGGTRTYTFSGLSNGPYSVVTYTARPGKFDGHLLVDIPGSNEGQLVASGIPTANTFTPGVSHVVHTLNVTGGGFEINLTDVAGAPAGYVDGFQLTLIPEPTMLGAVLSLTLPLARRRMKGPITRTA